MLYKIDLKYAKQLPNKDIRSFIRTSTGLGDYIVLSGGLFRKISIQLKAIKTITRFKERAIKERVTITPALSDTDKNGFVKLYDSSSRKPIPVKPNKRYSWPAGLQVHISNSGI